MMKDTLGHQTEDEKAYYDTIDRKGRIRALDTVIQKLQIEIASAERRENHTLSDEEVDGVMRNIANASIVSHNQIVTPGRTSAEMKEEMFKLMKQRDREALMSQLDGIHSDFAAAKNPAPSVPPSPFTSPSVSTASSGKNEEDDAHATVRKVLELVGGII